MVELKDKLMEFAAHLAELVKQIIAFEEVYSSVYQLPPTCVIAKRSKEKIQVDNISADCPKLKRMNTLAQYIYFIGVLNPNVHSFLPANIAQANLDEIINTIVNLETTTNDNSCFYKNANTGKSITCKTILQGEHTDIDLIDRLNALGDLRKKDGHERDKDENTLSLLIEYLGLGHFEKDKDQDLNVFQFYFMMSLRMLMNRVLKDLMYSTLLYYNITNYIYLKLLLIGAPDVKKDQDTSDRSIVDNIVIKLKDLFENILFSKFPAFREILQDLTASDTIEESIVHEVQSRNEVTTAAIKESLETVKYWQTLLSTRFPQLKTNQDEAMSTMMIVLLNYQSELKTLNTKIEKLYIVCSQIRRHLPMLKEQLEKIRKHAESTAEQKSIKSHKRRSSLFSSSSQLLLDSAAELIATFGKDGKDSKDANNSLKSSVH